MSDNRNPATAVNSGEVGGDGGEGAGSFSRTGCRGQCDMDPHALRVAGLSNSSERRLPETGDPLPNGPWASRPASPPRVARRALPRSGIRWRPAIEMQGGPASYHARLPSRSAAPAPRRSTRRHRIGPSWPLPRRRWTHPLLARSQPHRPGLLALQPREIRLFSLVRCCATAHHADHVAASLRFLEIQRECSILHLLPQGLDRF
jgi:hypothetical protein